MYFVYGNVILNGLCIYIKYPVRLSIEGCGRCASTQKKMLAILASVEQLSVCLVGENLGIAPTAGASFFVVVVHVKLQ